jgi:hypothetical protein
MQKLEKMNLIIRCCDHCWQSKCQRPSRRHQNAIINLSYPNLIITLCTWTLVGISLYLRWADIRGGGVGVSVVYSELKIWVWQNFHCRQCGSRHQNVAPIICNGKNSYL